MASSYFYKQDGKEYGPFDAASLRELATNGSLRPDDLVRKEGSSQWRAAKEARCVFSKTAEEVVPPVTNETNEGPEQGASGTGNDDFTTTVGASVLVGVAGGVVLHSVQWLCGWGWGSLWGLLSSCVMLTLGVIPWMLADEGIKSPAAVFGAGLGAALGVAYGWFTGGMLSGILFCTCVGAWAAWLSERKGLATKAAQLGAVSAALTGLHFLGMLTPTSGEAIATSPYSDAYWYAEGFDEGELMALKLVCAHTNPFTGAVSFEGKETIMRMLAAVNESLEKEYQETKQEAEKYKGRDDKERRRLKRVAVVGKGMRDGHLKIAAPFLSN